MISLANKTLRRLNLVFLLCALCACSDSVTNEEASSENKKNTNQEIDSPVRLDEQQGSDAEDVEGTLRLQEQLMANMQIVANERDEVANNNISTNFDNASEQHRQEFIDDTLEQTEKSNENEARDLAEKLENSKEAEHAPLEN